MTSIAELQERQRAWSERNFTDRRPDHAVMGLIEELGELVEAVDWADSPIEYIEVAGIMRYLGRLAHIHLKREQGIRKASTTDERLEDTASKLLTAVWEYHDWMRLMPEPNAVLEDFVPDEAKEQDAMGDLFVFAVDLANRRSYDAERIAEETLDTVTARDWIRDPALGGQGQEVA